MIESTASMVAIRLSVPMTRVLGSSVDGVSSRAMGFAPPDSRLRRHQLEREARMPTPTLIVGAPCWIDLYSSDPDKASAFYGELFGWTAQPPQEGFGGYFVYTKDGKAVAGCMRNDGSMGYPDAWGIHLMTDDVDRAAEATAKHGGSVEMGPMDVAE